ncbi:hypothetical protein C8F04DRAFT_1178338 [Mycena alexandri]|uniref:Myb/SANT-like domain-containing protein n=1 Tax=Mycena alexandri TaxID=1745969 RepID=A0AAD6T6V6_9AGAR|nr:hypothetical protein C8F04DRAFT_1178338 [Mycena alexandri]
MRGQFAADWVSNPEDTTHVLAFFHARISRLGEGGNPDKTLYNEAAAHMASQWPPKKGGPKTAKSIETKWKALRKLHGYILQAKQKAYCGASGWTYTDEGGFNVTDDDREAWENFVKVHPHFKPFATTGWIHFKTVDDMVPSRARGRYVFNAGSAGLTQSSQDDNEQEEEEEDVGQTQNSDASQPISNWSQTDLGDNSQNNSQLLGSYDDTSASQVNMAASPVVALRIPATPATALKRPSDVESPWSSKRSCATGPESIMALGRSVEGIGKVLETVFTTPKASSAMSPTKKNKVARDLALDDYRAGWIMSDERTRLNIFFGRDISAADAYIADEDPSLRAETGRELLNPTPLF